MGPGAAEVLVQGLACRQLSLLVHPSISMNTYKFKVFKVLDVCSMTKVGIVPSAEKSQLYQRDCYLQKDDFPLEPTLEEVKSS